MQKLVILALLLICIQAIKVQVREDEEANAYLRCQKDNCGDQYRACQKDSRCMDRVHHCSTPDVSKEGLVAMAKCVKKGIFLANELGSCWVKNCQ